MKLRPGDLVSFNLWPIVQIGLVVEVRESSHRFHTEDTDIEWDALVDGDIIRDILFYDGCNHFTVINEAG